MKRKSLSLLQLLLAVVLTFSLAAVSLAENRTGGSGVYDHKDDTIKKDELGKHNPGFRKDASKTDPVVQETDPGDVYSKKSVVKKDGLGKKSPSFQKKTSDPDPVVQETASGVYSQPKEDIKKDGTSEINPSFRN